MIRRVIHLQNNRERPCEQCEDGVARLSLETQRFPYGDERDQVILEALVPVWTCNACGFQYTEGDAEIIRHEAVCRHLRRLSPKQLRDIREKYGLSQQEWAEVTGFGSASIKRWETGNWIQTEAADRFLRLLVDGDV